MEAGIFKVIFSFIVELFFKDKKEASIAHPKFKPIKWLIILFILGSLYFNYTLLKNIHELGTYVKKCESNKIKQTP